MAADNLLRYATDAGDPNNPLTAGAPTWADAAQWHAQNLAATWRAVRDPQTWQDAARQYGNALLMGTTAPGIRAFHGSPYDFERFDASKIGTGQGAAMFGHGTYLAEHEPVAQSYRDMLAQKDFTTSTGARIPDWMGTSIKQIGDQFGTDSKLYGETIDRHIADFQGRLTADQKELATSTQPWNVEDRIANFGRILDGLQELRDGKASLLPRGRMYEVNVRADPEAMLDWDKPASEQAPNVQKALADLNVPNLDKGHVTGSAAYHHLAGEEVLSGRAKPDVAHVIAAQKLQDAGIPGIRYLDQGSRSTGTGTRNYVIFDPGTIEILRKYGIGGLIAGGGAAAGAASNGGQDQ